MERKILFSCVGEAEYSHPSVSAGHWFQDPKWYQNPRLPKSHKMVHLHITYAHPVLDIKSSMHYLMHHKCYVSRCQCTTNSSFAFWNFLIFFPNIFYLWLVESVGTEPVDTKEYMCSVPSCVPLFATLRTGAHQAPLSRGFSRQEDWSGLPCPPPGIFPTQGSSPGLLLSCITGGFFTTTPLGSPGRRTGRN